MSNDIIGRAMDFIFETDRKLLRENTIALIALHRQPSAGGPVYDIMHIGVRYQDSIWSHPGRPKQVRDANRVVSNPLQVINVLEEHEKRAAHLQSDYQILEKDTKRAQKTLTQLVRGVNTDQDIRDSLPECLAKELGYSAKLERTREPAFRYETLEPRLYANILKDLDMIEGYINARLLLS